jgi:hypothetical protein
MRRVLGKNPPYPQELQFVAEQPLHELAGLEAEVNLCPTLAVQALISLLTLSWPHSGHATTSSVLKTKCSNCLPQF